MANIKYLESFSPDSEEGKKPLTIRWDWNYITGSFEPKDKVKQTAEMVRLMGEYLDGISSNIWLKAYHSSSGSAGCLMVLLGLVLCFLLVPLVLVPLGIITICSPRTYYAYVFKKLSAFLEAYDLRHRNKLARVGAVVYTTFSRGSLELLQKRTSSLPRFELFGWKSSCCSSLRRLRPSMSSSSRILTANSSLRVAGPPAKSRDPSTLRWKSTKCPCRT